jgi:DNA-binding NarL/FixJ family response regulator
VVGAVNDGTFLIEAAQRLRPDAIVTDISMPGLNGIDALRRLKTARSETKVIVLTMHADAALANEAIRAGASGFVVKLLASGELVSAIDQALKGGVYLTAAVTGEGTSGGY